MKFVIVIPDGAADEPQESLGGKTPFQAARTPALDALATRGCVGLTNHVPESLPPGSEVACMSLMGYDPLVSFTGRAPLEAAAQGIHLGPDDWAVRCNLVTVVGDTMDDFTAGHITNPEATELLAAAQLACERAIWDRCINTSERTRGEMDMDQRFPTPFRDLVLKRTREIGLDPAYVYGLIRQESRFIMDARSHVGASGLMQVMPATARETARHIGLSNFTAEQINHRETNIVIGTAYLKRALDDFGGSMSLAAAAYNAGPSRPRSWRNGPVLDAAIWAENVPFGETRDYVKKVLANATVYAAVLSGQPQSLRERLGPIGPRSAGAPPIDEKMP